MGKGRLKKGQMRQTLIRIHKQMFKFFPVILLKYNIKKKVDQNHVCKDGLLIKKSVLAKKDIERGT